MIKKENLACLVVPFVTFIFYNDSLVSLSASTQSLRKGFNHQSPVRSLIRISLKRLQRQDKMTRREHRILQSVFFCFNAIANKGLSNRRSIKDPSLLPGARCTRWSIPEECVGRFLERALALSRKVDCERVGGCAKRRRGECGEDEAKVVRRTRKVEGWLGGTGGAVRAQHDAIRAGTRRSLRSERRDASAESVAWIARSVIAGTRGVPLWSRITLAVCSAERVVSLLSSCEPPRREEGRRGGGVPYHRSCSCVSIRPEELSLSLSLPLSLSLSFSLDDPGQTPEATRLVFTGFWETWVR